MKRFKTVLGIVIACVLLLSTAAWAAPKFISIATGGTGGAYFPIGAGLADVINKKLTGYNASAEVTGASKINCINVSDGKSDIALVLGDTLSYAYKGEKLGGFAKPLTNLRVIANIYANTIQIVARKDSGVTKLTDLKRPLYHLTIYRWPVVRKLAELRKRPVPKVGVPAEEAT